MKQNRLDKKFYPFILDVAGVLSFLVAGSSMEPVFTSNQRISVAKTTRFTPGNCYLYQTDGLLLLHRLTCRHGIHCIFMGDNSSTIQTVHSESVIGFVSDHKSRLFHYLVKNINTMYYNNIGTTDSAFRKKIRIKSIKTLALMDSLLFAKQH